MTNRFIGALVAAALLVLLSTVSVLAHSELTESDPADGETIETPYRLTATFSEEFDPDPQRSFILVEDSAGDEVARGGVSDDDPTMMAVDLPELQPGEYTVRWQTTTAEDQGVERGTYTFNIAASATPAPTATPNPTPSVAPATAPAATTTPAPTAAPTSTPLPGSMPEIVPNQTGTETILVVLVGLVAIGALFLFLRSRR